MIRKNADDDDGDATDQLPDKAVAIHKGVPSCHLPRGLSVGPASKEIARTGPFKGVIS